MGDVDERTLAAVDLIARTGAVELEVGYLHDDVPVEEAGWWASAQYRGAKVHVEDKNSPGHALDALLVRLLDGSTCRWCAKPVTNRRSANLRRYCRYEREGGRYVRGCRHTHHEVSMPVPSWARGGDIPDDGGGG